MKATTIKKQSTTRAKIKKDYEAAHNLAIKLAEKNDWRAIDSIKNCLTEFTPCNIQVLAEYNSEIERCQIITAFTYGTSLAGFNFAYHRANDVKREGKLCDVLQFTLTWK